MLRLHIHFYCNPSGAAKTSKRPPCVSRGPEGLQGPPKGLQGPLEGLQGPLKGLQGPTRISKRTSGPPEALRCLQGPLGTSRNLQKH